MANALYDHGREGFLDGSIDWDTDAIQVAICNTTIYSVDAAAHEDMADITAGAVNNISGAFGSKTVAAGVADAADVTISAVSGNVVDAMLVYKNTGSNATSRLIAYIDTATGLPLTPNGCDITIQWDAGANKIFKL